MVLDKLLKSGDLKADGHVTKKELDKIVDEIGKDPNLELLKQEISQHKKSVKDYIRKDVKTANEQMLMRDYDKGFVVNIYRILKNDSKYNNIIDELEKIIGTNIDIKKLSGPKCVAIVQAGLRALALLGKYDLKGADGTDIKIDGITGENTYFATMQYHKLSEKYKSTTKNGVGGRSDGVMNGRTVKAIFDELKSGKPVEPVKPGPVEPEPIEPQPQKPNPNNPDNPEEQPSIPPKPDVQPHDSSEKFDIERYKFKSGDILVIPELENKKGSFLVKSNKFWISTACHFEFNDKGECIISKDQSNFLNELLTNKKDFLFKDQTYYLPQKEKIIDKKNISVKVK